MGMTHVINMAGGEMQPPHSLAAKSSSQNPALASWTMAAKYRTMPTFTGISPKRTGVLKPTMARASSYDPSAMSYPVEPSSLMA